MVALTIFCAAVAFPQVGWPKDDRPVQLMRSAVSYTHLTLPTSDLVEIPVVAVSLKKKEIKKKKETESRIKQQNRNIRCDRQLTKHHKQERT